MKFRFKDWVVCTDPFYYTLERPGARESASNKREAAKGIIMDYKVRERKDRDKDDFSYLIQFDIGPNKWIEEHFLELYAGRDGPPFRKDL